MAAVSGDGDFGIELCKVLGLDPKKVKNIIITCKADSAVMVHTHSYLQDTETEGLLRLIEKYHLEENAEDKNKQEGISNINK